jgi:SAM-dependent methyltransferase
VGPGNSYFDYLTDYHSQVGDPTVEQQVGWDATREYVERQFKSMDRMREAASTPAVAEEIEPLLAITSERTVGRLMIYEPGVTHPLAVTRLDGWHRLFAARVFGVPQLRLEVMGEAEPKPVLGELESLEFDGNRLSISGWAISSESRLDLIEATLRGGAVVGGTTTTLREDIARRFAHLGVFSRRTGFELDKDLTAEARVETAKGGLLRFRLVALQEWMPVGEIDAFYLPGMFDVPWPDEDLARDLMGTRYPRRLSIDSLRRLRAMLEPVKRYRHLESFETVLDWGCRCGFLEAFIEHFMPHAAVTGIDTDARAIEWARAAGRPGTFSVVDPVPPTDLPADSFDLVLGHSMLPRLTAAEQSVWLAELHRVMRSGGYALLTVNGELLRPFLNDEEVKDEVETRGISSALFERYVPDDPHLEPRRGTFQTKDYSIREYSRTFDVLRYAIGTLNDEDLIVLRKP